MRTIHFWTFELLCCRKNLETVLPIFQPASTVARMFRNPDPERTLRTRRSFLRTAALAGAISHVLFVIEDLDSCFHGHWQVPRDAFLRVQAQIAGDGAPSSAAMRAAV